jgi:uncharacterized protein (TIGR03545 family)
METNSSTPNIPKKSGPIRWNAIVPFLIVTALAYFYFLMFFDGHIRKAFEWAGYKIVGAEVNIGRLKTNFINGNFQISKIQITNADKPEFNSLEIDDIRFDLNWDALLRVKFVIEEIAVEGLQFDSKRKFKGRVAPPEPPSDEPGFADQLKAKAINKLGRDNQNNILGDTAQFLKTGNFDSQISELKSKLGAKNLVESLNSKWKNKQLEWQQKVKTLPSNEEINSYKDRLSKIKFKDFSDVSELNSSAKEAENLIQNLNTRATQISDLKREFDDELKQVDVDKKAVEAQIKADINYLKSHLQIPKIDAANFAKDLFMGYLTPHLQKLDKYKALAQKYLPPKYAKMVEGKKTAEPDQTIKPLPRSQGLTYEFPVQNGYPLFWIQKISLSSKSNLQNDFGDISGVISDVTSNQDQIGKPTSLEISGEIKKLSVTGIKLFGVFDGRGPNSKIIFDFGIKSYPLQDLKLLDTKDGRISITTATSTIETGIKIVDFNQLSFKLVNSFNNVKFDISAQDAVVNEVLRSTLGGVSQFDLQASAEGEISNLAFDIRSGLGRDLERAFQSLLQNKINEANEKLQVAVNSEINKIKTQLNAQMDTIKKQAEVEVNKAQIQMNEQKNEIEQKIKQAKKDFEDRVIKEKKAAEDEAKRKLETELKKKADELKKRFGL